MTSPVWLIAGREFRTYVATASFWVALAIGPLLMAGGVLALGTATPPASVASLNLERTADGAYEATFSDAFPLDVAERSALLAQLSQASQAPVRAKPPAAAPGVQSGTAIRFATVMILWLTLTGSLGMLLQAIVRERANRALESLLAAASSQEVVFGKLLGVGAVSLLVLGAWLGTAALMGMLVPMGENRLAALLGGLAQPLQLARAGFVYVLALAFYGLTTIAIGGLARDNADAQNLARPLFAILLVVFFTSLSMAGNGAGGLGWLLYVPPFTPFMLLMSEVSPLGEAVALAGLGASTVLAARLAIGSVTLNTQSPSRRGLVARLSKSWTRRHLKAG